jgi:hypothetical protein
MKALFNFCGAFVFFLLMCQLGREIDLIVAAPTCLDVFLLICTARVLPPFFQKRKYSKEVSSRLGARSMTLDGVHARRLLRH